MKIVESLHDVLRNYFPTIDLKTHSIAIWPGALSVAHNFKHLRTSSSSKLLCKDTFSSPFKTGQSRHKLVSPPFNVFSIKVLIELNDSLLYSSWFLGNFPLYHQLISVFESFVRIGPFMEEFGVFISFQPQSSGLLSPGDFFLFDQFLKL